MYHCINAGSGVCDKMERMDSGYIDWKSTHSEMGMCQMKNIKYVKSKGRFWNRDILRIPLAPVQSVCRE